MSGAAGPFVAIALYFLSQQTGFPAWGFFLWPTSVLLLALSAPVSGGAALLITVSFGLNAVWLFLVGLVLAMLVTLTGKLSSLVWRRL
jgi:hypothetical protein